MNLYFFKIISFVIDDKSFPFIVFSCSYIKIKYTLKKKKKKIIANKNN